MFNDNKNFYPTPNNLIMRMIGKVNTKRGIKNVLEPSAGAGHIAFFYKDKRDCKIDVIELDSNLQKILIQDKYNLVGSDFLHFNDSKFYDLIIMNPPFDNGDKHLLKAIDLMYSGQIVCILNAETLKNPYSVTRKELVKRLQELGADIEYIQDAFLDSERKTSVEIALIYINIENELSKDLNLDLSVDKDTIQDIKEKTELEVNTDKMYNLVKSFENLREQGKSLLVSYYSNSGGGIAKYLPLSSKNYNGNINDQLKNHYNDFLQSLKNDYWGKVLDLPQVYKKLTYSTRNNLTDSLRDFHNLEFSEYNIKFLVENFLKRANDFIIKDTVKLFDDLTYCWAAPDSRSFNDKDIASSRTSFKWKTNTVFKVNKKIIIPLGVCAFISDYSKRWELSYRTKDHLHEIDVIFNYIAGLNEFDSLVDTVNNIIQDKQRGVDGCNYESSFFKDIKIYKKGTIHLTFKDDDLLRRFNIICGKEKNWLPNDYGHKAYSDMQDIEKELVKEYEDSVSVYNDNLGKNIYFKPLLLN